MKILCFLYLLYLGWKMIGSFSLIQKETGRPLKFYEASLFQFINPKAWSIAVTVASGFFPSEENIFIGVAFCYYNCCSNLFSNNKFMGSFWKWFKKIY